LLISPEKVSGKLPAILMIHNWKGITEETKKQAERFADLGYIVFAADIYGKGIRPSAPEDAGKMSGKYKADRKLYRENLNTALNELKKQANVDTGKLAAIGYCFGGTGALELARSGADVKGVISFHGDLDSPTPADGKAIKARVLALAGADDPYQKPENLTAFENEMRESKVDWQLVKFGGAVHSFTEQSAGSDNSKGAAYNEKADKRSFADAQAFLKETL
ncbi:MAG: dienelactone hydrolase family protein, partial [Bdellovibrionota bacterium]